MTPISAAASSLPETLTLPLDGAKTDDVGDKESLKSENVPVLGSDVKVDETDGSAVIALIPLAEGSGDAPADTSESKVTTTTDASAENGTVLTPDIPTLVNEVESKIEAFSESSTTLDPAAISLLPVEIDNEVPSSTVDTASVTTENAPNNVGTVTATVSSVEATTPLPSGTVASTPLNAETDKEVVSGLRFLVRKLGPVLAGPPRLLDMTVQLEAIPIPAELSTAEVDARTLQVAVARSEYIGGVEGQSEYWWFRISPDGRREQVTEPIAVASPTPIGDSLSWGDFHLDDPRFYRISEG